MLAVKFSAQGIICRFLASSSELQIFHISVFVLMCSLQMDDGFKRSEGVCWVWIGTGFSCDKFLNIKSEFNTWWDVICGFGLDFMNVWSGAVCWFMESVLKCFVFCYYYTICLCAYIVRYNNSVLIFKTILDLDLIKLHYTGNVRILKKYNL